MLRKSKSPLGPARARRTPGSTRQAATARGRLTGPARVILCIFALLLCISGLSLAQVSPAYALSTSKLTASPNADKGNDIIGAKTTRVTWEGYPESGEVVTQISITLPEGATCELDRTEATLITGADLLTRIEETGEVTQSGQTITVTLSNPQDAAGGYLRLTLQGFTFPASGGQMEFTGSYQTSSGTVKELTDMPSITVQEVSWATAAAEWLSDQEWVQAWNSVQFLQLFFNPVIAVRSLPAVFGGFLMALAVVILAFPCAIPIGLCLSLMRMAKTRVPRGIASLYVNIVRGTPLFLQIYIVFFGLPMAGISIPYYAMAVIVLALNSGAYLCEIFRAGIQSIPKGQFEASRSLGMNGAQTMMFVIIPQTVRRVIPTMTSEFILLFKDTSLLASVGYMEIIMYAKNIVASTGSITPYIVAACFYLVITLPLTKLVGNLERRLASNDNGASGKKTRAQRKAEKARRKERARLAKAGSATSAGNAASDSATSVNAASTDAAAQGQVPPKAELPENAKDR